jgi:hypothetical protein
MCFVIEFYRNLNYGFVTKNLHGLSGCWKGLGHILAGAEPLSGYIRHKLAEAERTMEGWGSTAERDIVGNMTDKRAGRQF